MNKMRKTGLIMLLAGTAITIGIIVAANVMFGEGNWTFLGYGFAIPGAMALVGLVQLVGGRPFGELAAQWDHLAGWQRGVLGLLIVIASLAVAIFCMVVYVQLTS